MSATAPVGRVLPTANVARLRSRAGASVDLYWIPLGAGDGTGLVKASGRLYERLAAWRDARRPRPLFHSALMVRCGGVTYAVEMAPVWGNADADRGVVAEGPVGLPFLGQTRLFRYEVRCWRNGRIPDLAESVGGPLRLSADDQQARRLLSLVRGFPVLTWGRDELRTGEMWNSNSLVSWLLARSGHDVAGLQPPDGGRAPGWRAGVTVAQGAVPARPRRWVGWREVARTLAALPSFALAPVHRSRHLHWGASDGEVRATMRGDDLVPHAHFTATRAVTVAARPDDVWPWLVQVGYRRAGFYSYDLLDLRGRPSAREILPEWQECHVGDVAAPMTAKATTATSFRVADVSMPTHLVWAKPDSSWAWQLRPLPDGRTRVVTRLKQHYRPDASSLVTVPLLELGDYPMMRRMLLGLKERCESPAAGRRS
jgi:hypothetical protein